MSIYSRARRHINMERVKEIREEKILEEEIAELIRQQEEIIAEIKKIKHIDWRKELEEGMTSSAMFLATLPAAGDDTTISASDYNSSDTSLITSAERSGSNVIFQQGNFNAGDATISGASFTHLRSFETGSIDASKSSHVTLRVTKPSHPLGASFESWQDKTPAEDFNDNIFVSAVADSSISLTQNLQNGTTSFLLPKNFRVSNLKIRFSQYGLMRGSGDSENQQGTQNPTFHVVTTQRKIPINVFVGLEDPDASAFLRDGQTDNLSPGEKKKKLEEQLASSKEYLNKMFGEGMPNTATTISDYEPQQSFSDIAQGLPYTDLDDAFDDPYYKGPPPDLDDDSDFDPDDFEYARIYPPDADPGDIQWPRKKNQKAPPGPGARPSGKPIGPELPRARKKPTTMVAHYEPQGEVISEKKRLKSPKDLADKIPGYYDGKPAPLGFPIVEPPKMKDGMHPDLVDGKKTAKRFNRLDPISAKAMPSTGNPLIDKKVKAAAKKPK